MKKLISILLAVILAVSVAAVSTGAVEYNPTDSYTVTNDTPTCEEAIKACNNGELGDVQYIYFQLPAVVPGDETNTTWTNNYNSTDLGLDYCQVCIYWWGGTAGEAGSWPSGAGCTWVGYRTTLVDAENRIYKATVPADGDTPLVIWNNGVNAGMDATQDIFKYGRQLADANIEGAYAGDYDTLPEGTPNEDNMDGCIQIINYDPSLVQHNPLTGFDNYGSDWYVYYGDGCYGCYPTTSENYHGKTESCVNPEHDHFADVSGAITSYLADDDVTVKLEGVDNDFTATVTGKTDYSIANVPAGEYKLSVAKKDHVTREYDVTVSGDTTQGVKICPIGDCDLNGKVQAADAMKAYQHAQGKADAQLSGYAFDCADVAPVGNPNGKVQAADAMVIYQQAQGKHSLF